MYILSEFFGRDMLFYTFEDFMKVRTYIKEQYALKPYEYKVMYNLYIESRPWIKEYYRGCIWDYLNDYLTEQEIISNYMQYKSTQRRKGGVSDDE